MNIILLLLSWIVVAFGQPAWSGWLAPLAACIGYAAFWKVAAEIPYSKKRFWFGVIWFTTIQLIQLSWMTSIEFQGYYILLVYGILSLCLGLQFGLITLFLDKIPLVATAALWTIMEWGRLHFLCGFSWNPVGLSLTAFVSSLQAASIFGVLGLSFLVILTNLAFWKKRYIAGVSLAVFPYLFGFGHLYFHKNKVDQSSTLSVGLVQTGLLPSQKLFIEGRSKEYIPPTEQWRQILSLLKTQSEKLDLIVLPEFIVPIPAASHVYPASLVRNIFEETLGKQIPVDPETRVSNQFWIQTIAKLYQADVIAGLEAKENGNSFTSAFYCPHQSEKMERYDKQILVPLAEYVPFAWVKNLTKAYGITEFFTHGQEAKVFPAKVPMSASICYEETFSYVMRENRRKGASFFVNLTNDNWYPDSRLPKQHFDHARLRAVENGVPMVRACNTGVTAAVDSLGRIIGQIVDERRAAVLVAHVPLYHYFTLYRLWGDHGIILISFIFLGICWYLGRKSSTKKLLRN